MNREAQITVTEGYPNGEVRQGTWPTASDCREVEAVKAPSFRIPSCARATRPDKEHVSMSEETDRYWNSDFRINVLEQRIG